AVVGVEPSTPSIRPYAPPAPTGGTKAFVVVEPERPAIKAATFTAVPAALAPIAAQPQPGKSLPGAQYKLPTDMGGDIVIRTELPGVDLVFTRESEGQLFDPIRAENQARPGAQRVTFPDRGVVTREKYAARNF